MTIRAHDDTTGELHIAGGRFSRSSRQAAIQQTLPLLATWFSKGHGWEATTVGLRREPEPLDVLLVGLLLRATTAASRALVAAAQGLHRHPTFRYRQERLRTTDFTRGTLDLARLATTTGLPEHPQKYPLVRTKRSTDTPENLLATWVAFRLRSDLRHILDLTIAGSRRVFIDGDSHDRRQGQSNVTSLDRLLQIPALRDALPTAKRLRRSEVERTLTAVKRRIARREVLDRDLHGVVVRIARDLLDGTPGARVGQTAWDFYDDTFDPRLFELWFLNELTSWLAKKFPVPPEGGVLRRKARGAYRSWALPHLRLDVHYQKSPTSIDAGQRPHWEGDQTSDLTGIPDITVAIHLPLMGVTRWALIDPKLRQRRDRPTEELFKLLGYFDNYDFGTAPYGAILYYAPRDPCGISQRWSTQAGGQLLAVGVDPDQPGSVANAVEAVGTLVLRLAGFPEPPKVPSADDGHGVGEATEQVQEATVAYLLERARELGPTLKPSMRQAKTALGSDRWRLLDKPTRRMVATALHIANQLDKGHDHSGPILGLCAAAERILRQTFTDPIVESLTTPQSNKVANGTKMLGAIISNVGGALDNEQSVLAISIRAGASAAGVHLERLRPLLPTLANMNRTFRIPAAHAEVLDHVRWEQAWELFMVHAENGPPLLRQVIDAAYGTEE